jgi:acetyl-CoA C-acetyltransferase
MLACREHGIGREAQDAHAARSYARAAAASAAGAFAEEIVAVEVPAARKGGAPTRVTADEAAAKGGDPATLAKCGAGSGCVRACSAACHC